MKKLGLGARKGPSLGSEDWISCYGSYLGTGKILDRVKEYAEP